MVSFKRRKGVNIGRVVVKITVTLISLWVGGVMVTSLGDVMLNTSSPFYKGLSLIGWTVGGMTNGTSGYYAVGACDSGVYATTGYNQNCITSTNGAGILAVIGIIGLASIVLEFVEFKM